MRLLFLLNISFFTLNSFAQGYGGIDWMKGGILNRGIFSFIFSSGLYVAPTRYNLVIASLNEDGEENEAFGKQGLRCNFDLEQYLFRNEAGAKIAVQTDGKHVIAGAATPVSKNPLQFSDTIFFRLNTDGIIDKTFGDNGYTKLDLGVEWSEPESVLIQEDGKVLFSGAYIDPLQSVSRYYLGRLDANGVLDASFGVNGLIKDVLEDSSRRWNHWSTVSVQPNGKLLLSGSAGVNADTRQAFLISILPNGKRDSDFGTRGIHWFDFGNEVRRGAPRSVVFQKQQDGYFKILLSGGYVSHDASKVFSYLARLDEKGKLDTSFGKGGILYPVDAKKKKMNLDVILLDRQNRILGTRNSTQVVRLFTNGEIDKSFGVDGVATFPHFGNYYGGDMLFLLSSGKFAVTSITEGPLNGNFVTTNYLLHRFFEDGRIDESFGDGGMITIDASSCSP